MNKLKSLGRFCLLLGLTPLVLDGHAQTTNRGPQAPTRKVESKYNYVEAFQPFFYANNGNQFRSASGKPGPKYWQNFVNYKIKTHLNDQTDRITATVTMDYTNNSPDQLEFIWLQLDQNMFAKDGRGQQILPLANSRYGDADSQFDGGYDIKNVQDGSGKAVKHFITDTRMQVYLDKPLAANGGKTTLQISYSYIVPKHGADRTSVVETPNGKIYAIAQWFPRVAVYDDIMGWNNQPYTGPGEFYLEFGNYDVEITAPADHIVVLGGELLNPQEVYTAEQFQRYQKAIDSEKTVMIRTPEEVKDPKSRPQGKKEITWKYRLNQAHDVAWASSKSFILDGAKINIANGKKALALSAYPVESHGDNAWERSTEYTKAAIEHYSNKWMDYPYPVAINVAANIGGMEYPAIVFCGLRSKGAGLWGVTNHEFGHIWFPMIVGSNERFHAWMDEGFNTFINGLATEAFNNGEYHRPMGDANRLAQAYTRPDLEPIMTTPQNMAERNIGTLAYRKPGYGLTLLREEILGRERFDRALKTYIDYWAYKHPTPEDFFRTIENVSGENLNWFWRGWFQNNWRLDQAIGEVKYRDNDPSKGVEITIDNLEKLPMPVVVEITTKSGQKQRIKLPVEIWERNISFTFYQATKEEIASVQIDPDKIYPDHNPDNNRWESTK